MSKRFRDQTATKRTPTLRTTRVGGPTRSGRQPAPWWLTAVVGTLIVAAGAWVLLAALSVIGWLMGQTAEFWDAVAVGGQLWLLIHAAPATLAGVRVSLPPLALTGLLMVALAVVAGGAVKAYAPQVEPLRRVVGVTGSITVTYAAAAVVIAFAVGRGEQVLSAGLSALLMAFASSLFGSFSVANVEADRRLPAWVMSLPRSALAGHLVLFAGGAVGVAVMLLRHAKQVAGLEAALNLGAPGTGMLTFAQAVYLPTFSVWAASFMVGTEIGLGDGSFTSLTDTSLGMLPGIPIFGAVPAPGPGYGAVGWLVVGVLAGVAVGFVHGWRRRRARIEQQVLTAAVAGLLSGVSFVVLAVMCRGDLGSGRLVGLGPAALPLLLMAPSILTIVSMLTALVLGLLARR